MATDEISKEINDIKNICKKIEEYIKKNDSDNFTPIMKTINIVINRHEQIAEKVKKLKSNLSILQVIKLYLHNAVDLLGKLCDAVAHLFTQTLPNTANSAKNSLTTSFNKFRVVEASNKTAGQRSSILGPDMEV